jgi:hypothetical protein
VEFPEDVPSRLRRRPVLVGGLRSSEISQHPGRTQISAARHIADTKLDSVPAGRHLRSQRKIETVTSRRSFYDTYSTP